MTSPSVAQSPRPASQIPVATPSSRPSTPSYARAAKASLPADAVGLTVPMPAASPSSPRSASSATSSVRSPYARPPPSKPAPPRRLPGQVPGAAPPTAAQIKAANLAAKRAHARSASTAAATAKSLADVSNGGRANHKRTTSLSLEPKPPVTKLSPLAPSFSFRPDAPPFTPSFAPTPAAPAPDLLHVRSSDDVAEESPVEEATAPSPSLKELAIEAEDELEDGEIREQSLPATSDEASPDPATSPVVESAALPEPALSAPEPSPQAEAQASLDSEVEQTSAATASEVAEAIAPIQAADEHLADVASEVAEAAAPVQAEEERVADVASEVADAAEEAQEAQLAAQSTTEVAQSMHIQTEDGHEAEVASEVAESAQIVDEPAAQDEPSPVVEEPSVEAIPEVAVVEVPTAAGEELSAPVDEPVVVVESAPVVDELPIAAEKVLETLNARFVVEVSPVEAELPTSAEEALEVLNERAVSPRPAPVESLAPTPVEEIESPIPATLAENEIPTSAEQVAALPTLEDALDVKDVPVASAFIEETAPVEQVALGATELIVDAAPEPIEVSTAASTPSSEAPTESTVVPDEPAAPSALNAPASDVRSLATESSTAPPPQVRHRRRSSSPPPPSAPLAAPEPPSLTLAIVSAWNTTSWAQRLPAIIASVAINFGLPFINGVMLGFGELFARNYLGVRLGWGNPFNGRASANAATGARANTSSLGLNAGGSNPLKGGAGARTVASAVGKEGAVLAGEGLRAAATT